MPFVHKTSRNRSTLPQVVPAVVGWVTFLLVLNLHEFHGGFENWYGFPFVSKRTWTDTLSPPHQSTGGILANIAFGVISTAILAIVLHLRARTRQRRLTAQRG